MIAHQMQTVHDTDHHVIRAECSCGNWTGVRDLDGKAGSLTRQHIEHQRTNAAADVDLRKSAAVAWYVRTGHCSACGSPGTYCLCVTPCGCSDLHSVGSGLSENALDQYRESSNEDQASLW